MLRAVLALRLREPKIQKSKTLLRGPKLLDFLVFLGFFLVCQQKSSQKTHGFFWFSNRNPKKHRVFLVFHQRPNKKTKKTLCFLVFHLKSKKNHVIFWISVGKPKNPRNTKNSKSFGPRRKVSDFWIFGFLVFWFPPS